MKSQSPKDKIARYFPKPMRVFFEVVAFLVALDASIALNRWWLEGGFQTYLQNLVFMFVGFAVFIILASNSRIEFLGYSFLVIAIYYVCSFEIGGPSKFYLTPFDPLFGAGPVFADGSTWYGLSSIVYRRSMAALTSVITASIFAFSKLKRRSTARGPAK